jgi:hypothetical protein
MKLVTYYTNSHKDLFDNYFLPSIKSDFGFDLLHKEGIQYSKDGNFDSLGFNEATRDKIGFLISTLDQVEKFDFILFSDVDIVFLKNPSEYFKKYESYDIVFQDGYEGHYNTGFFLLKNKDKVKELLQKVYDNCHLFIHDQDAMNHFLHKSQLKYTKFDTNISSTATFFGPNVWDGENFHIDFVPIIFHACWTKGIENKKTLLNRFIEFSDIKE